MAAVPGGVGVYAGAYYYYFFGAGTGVVIIGFVACATEKKECAKQGDGEEVFHGVIFCGSKMSHGMRMVYSLPQAMEQHGHFTGWFQQQGRFIN